MRDIHQRAVLGHLGGQRSRIVGGENGPPLGPRQRVRQRARWCKHWPVRSRGDDRGGGQCVRRDRRAGRRRPLEHPSASVVNASTGRRRELTGYPAFGSADLAPCPGPHVVQRRRSSPQLIGSDATYPNIPSLASWRECGDWRAGLLAGNGFQRRLGRHRRPLRSMGGAGRRGRRLCTQARRAALQSHRVNGHDEARCRSGWRGRNQPLFASASRGHSSEYPEQRALVRAPKMGRVGPGPAACCRSRG